ncbi:ribose 5-phosphate isomerase B [Sulfurospirillum arcachonense]|uniref:ribose 5-phosphate isomerase B n=1 Tax=Sulfurospirillum arcachonense TaxID=57666 RepID=UPI000467F88A|nr:ribose 5-phosphate isomerase B [Sulfurospirillum arcachonense]
MKIFIASDHAGVAIKPNVIEMLEKRGNEVVDLGTNDISRVDYTDFAHKLCEEVLKNKDTHGVLICGSGIGMSLAANKHVGIRAALCHDAYTAEMARAHNDANVLCFGERIVGLGVAESIIDAWCNGVFEGGRHAQRVNKIEVNPC